MYDGKCEEGYIENFCNYLQISRDDFDKTCEKFRGDIWENKNGELKNRIHENLKKIND